LNSPLQLTIIVVRTTFATEKQLHEKLQLLAEQRWFISNLFKDCVNILIRGFIQNVLKQSFDELLHWLRYIDEVYVL
jgi:hypothetical protein